MNSDMSIEKSGISVLVVSYARCGAKMNVLHKFLRLINHDVSDRFVPSVIDGLV
jgi:hypothetical protein